MRVRLRSHNLKTIVEDQREDNASINVGSMLEVSIGLAQGSEVVDVGTASRRVMNDLVVSYRG